MYSQCPECQTRFRVTAEALRAAHGTVRCGRCGIAFDALVRLSDTLPPLRASGDELAVAGEVALASLPAAAVATEYHFTADDLEKVFIDAREWQEQFGPDEAAEELAREIAPEAEPPVVLVDENEPIEDITLEGERISIEAPSDFDLDSLDKADDLDSTDEFEVLVIEPERAPVDDDSTGELPASLEPPAAPAPEPQEVEAASAVEPSSAPTAEPAADAARPDTASADTATTVAATAGTLAEQRWRRTAEPEPSSGVEEAAPARGSRWRVVAWSAGCVLLAIGLLAQVAHYYRQDLARHPQLGPPLKEVYDRLGLPLSATWDPASFELRQWGASEGADDRGHLTIRASLTNRASFAQPHPVLRLQLEDRFGESIAVRDFEPDEYLKNPAEATRQLAPGASTEADLAVVDPGPDAVGYRLDVCLRESPTLLRCAQGVG